MSGQSSAPSRLEGRVALITGSGSGIGRAMARACAREGAAVLCVDIDDEGVAETVAAIEADGARAAAVHADVSAEADVQRALDEAVERFGRLDVIMNNAGVGGARSDWAKTIAVNLEGVYHGLALGAPMLAERGGGAIVNTASVGGLVALRHHARRDGREAIASGPAGYVAAKHGVVGLTRQFAVAYAPRGVRVNAVAPGGTDTPMLAAGSADRAGRARAAGAIHPMRRVAQPEEIAAAAVFLASDEASFITGVVLPVDGGYTAQ